MTDALQGLYDLKVRGLLTDYEYSEQARALVRAHRGGYVVTPAMASNLLVTGMDDVAGLLVVAGGMPSDFCGDGQAHPEPEDWDTDQTANGACCFDGLDREYHDGYAADGMRGWADLAPFQVWVTGGEPVAPTTVVLTLEELSILTDAAESLIVLVLEDDDADPEAGTRRDMLETTMQSIEDRRTGAEMGA